jgi:hypothetical protein
MKARLSGLLMSMMTVAALSAIQPGVVSAQTSGVGPDGFTRILWRGTDGKVVLWKLNAGLLKEAGVEYGPYPGYDPIAITVGSNNNTYVLWAHTNGSVALWMVDSTLNGVAAQVFGPYEGWKAQGLGSGGGQLRVIWRHTTGQVSVWAVNPSSLAVLGQGVHGPFFGFDPGAP